MPDFNHHSSRIESELYAHNYPNILTLVELLGVDERTVFRALSTLRGHHDLKIPFDRQRDGYHFECWPQSPYLFEILGDGPVGTIARVSYALTYDFVISLCTHEERQVVTGLPLKLETHEGTKLILCSTQRMQRVSLDLKMVTVVAAQPFGGCAKTYRNKFRQ